MTNKEDEEWLNSLVASRRSRFSRVAEPIVDEKVAASTSDQEGIPEDLGWSERWAQIKARKRYAKSGKEIWWLTCWAFWRPFVITAKVAMLGLPIVIVAALVSKKAFEYAFLSVGFTIMGTYCVAEYVYLIKSLRRLPPIFPEGFWSRL